MQENLSNAHILSATNKWVRFVRSKRHFYTPYLSVHLFTQVGIWQTFKKSEYRIARNIDAALQSKMMSHIYHSLRSKHLILGGTLKHQQTKIETYPIFLNKL